MTKAEKKRLSTVIRATEYLFLENIALKLVLEHRSVPNWQKLLERLLSDKEMLAGVRLKFRDLYDRLEGSEDPSDALEAILRELPAPKKNAIAVGPCDPLCPLWLRFFLRALVDPCGSTTTGHTPPPQPTCKPSLPSLQTPPAPAS
jgi:hypothetical protein